jgi:AraC-like DNA-binding protein
MDFLIKHWAPYSRRFPGAPALVSSDLVLEKSGWVRSRFTSCNYSIILRGEGRFERLGKVWPVVAPCVITQWPGERVDYGPTGGTWTEWYCVYDRSEYRKFISRGMLDPQKPVWPVADPASLQLHLSEFAALARAEDPAWVVDLVDRVAERAILSTWLAPGAPSDEHSAFRAMAVSLRQNLAKAWDFERLAMTSGHSVSTFRRRWIEVFGRPPSDYLRHLRLAEACRLLAETTLLIKEIASRTGFPDELYFSRRFHLDIGKSPSDYRRMYQLD